MAALVINLPTLMQGQPLGSKTLADAGDIANILSYDNGSATQDAVTASTTQTQVGGTKITAAFTNVTSANASDAITLPQAAPGRSLTIVNSSGQTIQVFPFLADQVGANGANSAITVATARMLTLVCTARLTWWGGVTTVS